MFKLHEIIKTTRGGRCVNNLHSYFPEWTGTIFEIFPYDGFNVYLVNFPLADGSSFLAWLNPDDIKKCKNPEISICSNTEILEKTSSEIYTSQN